MKNRIKKITAKMQLVDLILLVPSILGIIYSILF